MTQHYRSTLFVTNKVIGSFWCTAFISVHFSSRTNEFYKSFEGDLSPTLIYHLGNSLTDRVNSVIAGGGP
ncbi:hypothetical protein SAMN05192561_11251 [Halopenitus malekzadehii]|uniref:Uncharacterized protein n=1 Tax=Halopenitus malekzadehii TaxID=1267564 RepID=A0A1H6JG51_9EURY|nr:hypothetical protein SAMN05192561_11251 [Halopenitus malekzadehii]